MEYTTHRSRTGFDRNGTHSREIGHLDLVQEPLVAAVYEMRADPILSSYSSIVYDEHDFSRAPMTAGGRLVAQSLADHPIYAFAVPFSPVKALKRFQNDIGCILCLQKKPSKRSRNDSEMTTS